MSEILIECSTENESFFINTLNDYPNTTDLFTSEGFDGSEQLIQFAVVLVPTLIPAVAGIIVALVNAQKTFRLKLKANDNTEFEVECKGYSMKRIKNDILTDLPKSLREDETVSELINSIESNKEIL